MIKIIFKNRINIKTTWSSICYPDCCSVPPARWDAWPGSLLLQSSLLPCLPSPPNLTRSFIKTGTRRTRVAHHHAAARTAASVRIGFRAAPRRTRHYRSKPAAPRPAAAAAAAPRPVRHPLPDRVPSVRLPSDACGYRHRMMGWFCVGWRRVYLWIRRVVVREIFRRR